MREFTNNRLSNILGFITLILTTAAADCTDIFSIQIVTIFISGLLRFNHLPEC